jgi:benzoyl-CoA reductase/2-hydroxyglutaryl-CoA dehydratase subunit BcrC/BadD/HgdB
MMDKGFVMRDGENGFERALGILDMISLLPDTISDEEIEGSKDFTFPDLQNTFLGVLELESSREVEILLFKRLMEILREAQSAQASGKKLVFIPFTFPPEILWGFETVFPVCTEIVGGLITNICAGQGERFWDFAMGLGLPDSLCSANTIAVASLLAGPGLKPDAIVSNSPGSCNPNAKIHAFASDYMGIPQFILEKPVDESRRGRELYFEYLKRLIADIEEWAGEELKEDRLRAVMEKSYECVRSYYDLWELRKAKPCPVPNMFNITLLVARAQMWGRQEAVDVMQRMVEVAKERLARGDFTGGREVARVYMGYIYFLFDFAGFFTWMEKKGISILGDVLAIHYFPEMDMTSKDSMLRGLSQIAFDFPMTRQMGASSISVQWVEDIKYAIQDLDADACIYCGHHACKHTAGAISYFRKQLMKELKVPTLLLMGDAFDKRHLPTSMIQEEIDLFIDHVVSRKNAPRRAKKGKKSAAEGSTAE